MGLLLNDPCDSLAAWTVIGTVTVVAGSHTGNGFQFVAGSGNEIRYSIPAPDQTDTMTVGFNYRPATAFGTAWQLIEFFSDSAATLHGFAIPTATVFSYRRASFTLASSASGFATNTWHYVEAKVKLHDTLGTVELRVNGTPVATATNVDTKNVGTKTVFDTIGIRSAGGVGTWQVDNIYIRNDGLFGTVTAPQVGVWTGSAFVDAPVKVWNGTTFVDATAVQVWNGSSFVDAT